MRLRKGQRCYWIDGEGVVRAATYVAAMGPYRRLRAVIEETGVEGIVGMLSREDVYGCKVDAENYARIVRGWLDGDLLIL